MAEHLPVLKKKNKKLARRNKQKGAISEATPKEDIIKNCWVSDKGTDIICLKKTTKRMLKETNDP